jgi:hypothetical protein
MDFNKSKLSNLPDVTLQVLMNKQEESSVMQAYLKGMDLKPEYLSTTVRFQPENTSTNSGLMPRVGS